MRTKNLKLSCISRDFVACLKNNREKSAYAASKRRKSGRVGRLRGIMRR
jgi:hypothetical protein